MNLTLNVWRQKSVTSEGKLVSYNVTNINPDMSFLEMIDVLNEDLSAKGEVPVEFDHDCREGICGSCSMVINGRINHHGHFIRILPHDFFVHFK